MAGLRGPILGTMDRRPVPRRPLLALLPTPARRAAGFALLALTLWLGSFLALVR